MAYKTLRRCRIIKDFDMMKKICDIASKHTTILEVADDSYVGKGVMNSLSFTHESEKFYFLTTAFAIEIKDNDGNVDYKDLFEVGGNRTPCTFKFAKTGNGCIDSNLLSISMISNRTYKPFNEVKENPNQFTRDERTGKIQQSASPMLGYNNKFDKTEHHAVCYDLNSAYAAVLRDKIIDTYNRRDYGMVGENEIGFMKGDSKLSLIHPGQFADIIFPLIDSPYRDYVDKWYNIKKTAPKGSAERQKAKDVLVITIGMFQNKNPYLRAYIVNTVNEYLKSFLKKYPDKICLWNTDSLHCTEHIKELDDLCGPDIGQFKLEYDGLYRQVKTNYQKIEKNETVFRGVMQEKLGNNFNILTDDIQKIVAFKYRKNPESLCIEENPLWQGHINKVE